MSPLELAAFKPWSAEYFLAPDCRTLEASPGEFREKFGPVHVLLVGVCLASEQCVRSIKIFFDN